MGENKVNNQRYVFAVSDATGETCQRVVNAALTQFKTTKVIMKVIANVTTQKQVESIIKQAAPINGVIVYTMVSPQLRQEVTELGRQYGVPTVDILGPILTRFSDLLEISPMAKPGLLRHLDDEYFKRIEAVDYTIKHDDSMGLATLEKAEIVLLGVSRTTKTPVSIYLSYRGWKVANIPVILNQPLPTELFKVDPKRIVALSVNPNRLHLIRLDRQIKLHSAELRDYSDMDYITQEVIFGLHLYQRYGWAIVNVTFKSIEETATEIMRTIYRQVGDKKGQI